MPCKIGGGQMLVAWSGIGRGAGLAADNRSRGGNIPARWPGPSRPRRPRPQRERNGNEKMKGAVAIGSGTPEDLSSQISWVP